MFPGFYNMFLGLPEEWRETILHYLLEDLEEIKNWFSTQRRLSFRGSSVLIVFESDRNVLHSCATDANVRRSRILQVKLIDFVHVWETDKLDTNYLEGVTNLGRYFTSLLEIFRNSSKFI